MKNIENLLRAMPKVDLHCHLDGSIRCETILALAKSQGYHLPTTDPTEIKKYVQAGPNCRSLSDFLQVFNYIYPLLRQANALKRIAYELCEDCAKDNIRYVEVRFAPLLCAHDKFSTQEVIESVLEGLAMGGRDFGVDSSVIVCLIRSFSPQENWASFEAAQRFYGRGVVALDLAGDESKFPTQDFALYFERAKTKGMAATCHAGEAQGLHNLKSALSFGVERIGHGTHLMDAPDLLQEVLARNIVLEVGLTSNVRTRTVASYEEHPLRQFLKAGVRVTLNTDDKGILDIDLTHEYVQAYQLGISLSMLAQIALNGVSALFLPDVKKQKIKKLFEEQMNSVVATAGV